MVVSCCGEHIFVEDMIADRSDLFSPFAIGIHANRKALINVVVSCSMLAMVSEKKMEYCLHSQDRKTKTENEIMVFLKLLVATNIMTIHRDRYNANHMSAADK